MKRVRSPERAGSISDQPDPKRLKVDEVKEEAKQGFVYVWQLERDKFYVGWTEREHGQRLQEHVDGLGSKWTKLYRPLYMLEWQPGSKQDEDRVTLNLMRAVGWWNVRGGRWCAVDLRQQPVELGGSAHIRDIVHNAINAGKIAAPSFCTRCKRTNHTLKGCFASVGGVVRCTTCQTEGHMASTCSKEPVTDSVCVIM